MNLPSRIGMFSICPWVWVGPCDWLDQQHKVEGILHVLDLRFKRPSSFCFWSSCHERHSSTLRRLCFEEVQDNYVERLPGERRGGERQTGRHIWPVLGILAQKWYWPYSSPIRCCLEKNHQTKPTHPNPQKITIGLNVGLKPTARLGSCSYFQASTDFVEQRQSVPAMHCPNSQPANLPWW